MSVSNTRDAFNVAVNPPSQQTDQKYFQQFLSSSVGQSVLAFIITVILLYIINPPMIQTKTDSDIEKSVRSMKKIFVWALIVGILTFLIPIGIARLNK